MLSTVFFGHLIWRVDSLEKPWCWERLRVRGKGSSREWDDWMASPTQWTEFEHIQGDGEGQGSLVCCSSWGCKETRLNDWEILWFFFLKIHFILQLQNFCLVLFITNLSFQLLILFTFHPPDFVVLPIFFYGPLRFLRIILYICPALFRSPFP